MLSVYRFHTCVMKEVKKYLDILDTWECNFLLCIFTFCKILQMCKEVTDITSYCGLIKKPSIAADAKYRFVTLNVPLMAKKQTHTYLIWKDFSLNWYMESMGWIRQNILRLLALHVETIEIYKFYTFFPSMSLWNRGWSSCGLGMTL